MLKMMKIVCSSFNRVQWEEGKGRSSIWLNSEKRNKKNSKDILFRSHLFSGAKENHLKVTILKIMRYKLISK